MKTYQDIMLELKKPFPQGTIIKSGDKRAHIPVQVYMKRLEDVAAEQWHWRIVDEPMINLAEGFVIVKGELIIAGAVRQGLGTAFINKNEIRKLKSALGTAESESFRDACDKFLMGWVDLASYRDWGSSPAIRFDNIEQNSIDSSVPTHSHLPSSSRKCSRCKKVLSGEEEMALTMYGINYPYCTEHIPSQFKKK